MGTIGTIRKQFESYGTQLYWMGIKMQNNTIAFEQADMDHIVLLQYELESLLELHNQILDLSKEIRSSAIELLKGKGEMEATDSDYHKIIASEIYAVNEKISFLQTLCSECNKNQNEFADKVKCLELNLREKIPKRKKTIVDTLKDILENRR
ncbi:MAG: hypothetical protein J6J86_01075 [Lachnospiraceae bacterium]|nr:hypothetical protein [Lachnospiraceae bacterium]